MVIPDGVSSSPSRYPKVGGKEGENGRTDRSKWQVEFVRWAYVVVNQVFVLGPVVR